MKTRCLRHHSMSNSERTPRFFLLFLSLGGFEVGLSFNSVRRWGEARWDEASSPSRNGSPGGFAPPTGRPVVGPYRFALGAITERAAKRRRRHSGGVVGERD